MRDPRKKKLRDLRRIARSGHNPSIFDLFHKYHPEAKEQEKQIQREYRVAWYYWNSSEWKLLQNMENDWAVKIAGCWDAIGGSSSYFRDGRRAREKQALRRAVRDDAWDDFFIPRERCDWD